VRWQHHIDLTLGHDPLEELQIPSGSAPERGQRWTFRTQRLNRARHSGLGSRASDWKRAGPKQVTTSRAVKLDPSDSSTRTTPTRSAFHPLSGSCSGTPRSGGRTLDPPRELAPAPREPAKRGVQGSRRRQSEGGARRSPHGGAELDRPKLKQSVLLWIRRTLRRRDRAMPGAGVSPPGSPSRLGEARASAERELPAGPCPCRRARALRLRNVCASLRANGEGGLKVGRAALLSRRRRLGTRGFYGATMPQGPDELESGPT
jgi:hypothetical protein